MAVRKQWATLHGWAFGVVSPLQKKVTLQLFIVCYFYIFRCIHIFTIMT